MVLAKSRVLIVDDHPVCCSGLEVLVNAQGDLAICGQAGDFRKAKELLEQSAPDLMLLDLLVGKTLALEFIREVKTLHRHVCILVISMMDEKTFAARCLRAGASGFINKSELGSQLVAAMRIVLSGGIYISPSSAKTLLHRGGPDSTERSMEAVLSDRELQIFQMIGIGLKSGEIARRLFVSSRTIHAHKAHIRNKLGLGTAAELAVRASGWVSQRMPELATAPAGSELQAS